jgi:hypothetical protein
VIVAGYSIAERFATSSYIIWVALSLDTVLSIFWLSAMSALAALRNLLIMPSYLLDKRTLQRRYMLAWASNDWLAIESAVIAIAAIQTYTCTSPM